MKTMFYAWNTLNEFNGSGVTQFFTYPASIWSGFIPLVLLALFSIVMMSSFFSQKRLTGKGDFYASFAVAGFFIAVVSSVMMLVDGLINLQTVVICIAIAIIATILLLTSKDK